MGPPDCRARQAIERGDVLVVQRYYSAGMGRFWSPDPAGIKTADPTDSGSWNRYAYVSGDPVNYLDSTGWNREGPEDPQPTFCDVYPDDPSCDPWFEPFQQPTKKPPSRPSPCDTSNPLNAQAINWISQYGQNAADAAKLDKSTEVTARAPPAQACRRAW